MQTFRIPVALPYTERISLLVLSRNHKTRELAFSRLREISCLFIIEKPCAKAQDNRTWHTPWDTKPVRRSSSRVSCPRSETVVIGHCKIQYPR